MSLLAQLVDRVEHRLYRVSRWLKPRALKAAVPNNADQWEQLCQASLKPVTDWQHPLTAKLISVTSPGDLLLEAGCGMAQLSAQLALAGRRVALCDFSSEILKRAERLFAVSELPLHSTTCCDITRPLPWDDRTFDVTWSSGVLEHWTDEELVPIVGEMRRISRKAVMSLVPYSGCVLYRLGKFLAEERGCWPYGREIPRQSLADVFRAAGLRRVTEEIIWSQAACGVLSLVSHPLLEQVEAWWASLPADDPLRAGQGYLLMTVGRLDD